MIAFGPAIGRGFVAAVVISAVFLTGAA